jgi:hypothetical protein
MPKKSKNGIIFQSRELSLSPSESKKRIALIIEKQSKVRKSAEAPLDAMRKIRFTF